MSEVYISPVLMGLSPACCGGVEVAKVFPQGNAPEVDSEDLRILESEAAQGLEVPKRTNEITKIEILEDGWKKRM